MAQARPFCADISRESAEPLAATASRVDHWILVEYGGLWARDPVASSGLSDQVKAHLRERAAGLGLTKLLFVRRTERRRREGVAVYWGSSPERRARLYRAELAGYDDLLGLDFASPGEDLDHPLLLVCTHGKHDRCCARYGRPLYQALRELVEDDWIWQTTHVGGDRFAGNLVCLPEALYFGRVGSAEAWPVLEDYLARRIHLPHYRGRSCYPFPVQAAERHLREQTGLLGIDDLALRSVVRDAEGWRVSFAAAGSEHEVAVVRGAGELTYLTCSATALRHPRRFAARTLPGSAA